VRRVRERLAQAAAARGDGTGPLQIPNNFTRTAPVYVRKDPASRSRLSLIGSPQTDELLKVLELPHIITVPFHDLAGAAPPEAAEGQEELFFYDRGGGE
jgi:hypothetical protein